MALINLKNKYIKLHEDGLYEIYASEDARQRFKESTASEIIINKYLELILELEVQEEFRYYDPKSFAAKYNPLVLEYETYRYNLANYITGQEYPIIATYYPDVADSIPEILEAGYVSLAGEDLDKIYITAKQVKRFGETTDA
jgi:hypothetical protein